MEVPSVQFWSACVKTGAVTHMSTGAGDDVLNLRMACLGEAPADGSRTVLFCAAENKPKAPICILREGSCENQAMELKFPGSTKISFSLGGTNPSPVHLSGFIEPLIEMSFGDDEPNTATESSKPAAEIVMEEQIQVGSKRAAPKASEQDEPPKKKMKEQPKEQEEEKKVEEDAVVVESANISQQPPAEKLETVKKSVEEGSQKSQMSTPGSQKKKKGKKQKKRKKFTFNNGLGVRVTKQGKGPAAGKGDTVRVRYIGQLEDDTIFDKNLGEGLVIQLGKGDVIKGLDLGLQGIKAHEKRKMIIPSKLAYGEEGDEKIPANAELWFTLECLELIKA